MSRVFFRRLSIFFSFGIPIEKRTADLLFWRSRNFFRGVLRSRARCLARPPSTAPWEAPSREGLYGRSPSTRQVLSITFDRFSNLIHKLWITLGCSLLIVHPFSQWAAAAYRGLRSLARARGRQRSEPRRHSWGSEELLPRARRGLKAASSPPPNAASVVVWGAKWGRGASRPLSGGSGR